MQLLFAPKCQLSYCSSAKDNSGSCTQKQTAKWLASYLALVWNCIIPLEIVRNSVQNSCKRQGGGFVCLLVFKSMIQIQEYVINVWSSVCGHLLGTPATRCSCVVKWDVSTEVWELSGSNVCWNGLAAMQQNLFSVVFFYFSVIKRLAWNYFVCLFCLAHSFMSLLFFFLALIFFFFLTAHILFIVFLQQTDSHTCGEMCYCQRARSHVCVWGLLKVLLKRVHCV